MEATSDVVDWSCLALLLGVSDADVERIEWNNPREKLNQHKAIVRAWLNNGEASWAILVAGLRNKLVSKVAVGNQIARDHSTSAM